jgi:cytochrome oxidase Cu insertion factor (SCO1/SenC/PrrC family)
MQLKKVLVFQFILLVTALFLVSSGSSQEKKEGALSFFGSIDSIPESRRFIVVNEQRVYITSNTKIVDENNNQLKMNQLKRGLSVRVEGIRKTEGIYPDKITVIRTPKRNP